MSKINPKAMKAIFTDEVKEVLPQNNELRRGVGNAKAGQTRSYLMSQWDEDKRNDHATKSARHGSDNGMTGNGHYISGKKNGFYGKTHRVDTKKQLSVAATNRPKDHTCEHCGKVVDAQTYGTHHGKYCKKNLDRVMRNTTLGKKMPQSVEVCPHCGMSGGAGMMRRFHGDKCFMNGYYIQSYVDGKKNKLYKTHKSIVDDGHLFDRVKKVCLGKKPTYNGIVFVLVKKK